MIEPQSTFEDQNCVTCSIRFRVPIGFTGNRRKDGQPFYCPNGHRMFYNETEADQIRRERDRLKQQLAEKDDRIARANQLRCDAEARADAAEKKTKRIEKRIHAGVCPCCNRTFSALAKHIATKHPDFRAEDIARENVVSLVKARSS